MIIDKKKITNVNVRGQIQITLNANGLKEANIEPASDVNVIYDKDTITIVKQENIELFFRSSLKKLEKIEEKPKIDNIEKKIALIPV